MVSSLKSPGRYDTELWGNDQKKRDYMKRRMLNISLFIFLGVILLGSTNAQAASIEGYSCGDDSEFTYKIAPASGVISYLKIMPKSTTGGLLIGNTETYNGTADSTTDSIIDLIVPMAVVQTYDTEYTLTTGVMAGREVSYYVVTSSEGERWIDQDTGIVLKKITNVGEEQDIIQLESWTGKDLKVMYDGDPDVAKGGDELPGYPLGFTVLCSALAIMFLIKKKRT